MKNWKDFLILGVIVGFVAVAIIFGIDRELARRDYVNGDMATACIFEANCDHYNAMALDDF